MKRRADEEVGGLARKKRRRSDDCILEIDCEVWRIKGLSGQEYDQIA
jgi:hypothetical protein